MSVEHFLDTNVFVYMFDETNDRKRGRAVRLVQKSLGNETGCISYQVVQETMNVIIRKLNATPEKGDFCSKIYNSDSEQRLTLDKKTT